MTIIRLCGGEILLHSPCRPSQDLVRDIAGLGTVTHVIAPNWFHDLYLNDYRKLYPGATFWGCRRLRTYIDREIDGGGAAPWSEELPHFTLNGLLTFDESIFFHRASRTLIVADLLLNERVRKESPLLTKIGLGMFGMDGTVRLFPVLRWFGLRAARQSVRAAAEQIVHWQPERLIPGHGTPVSRISSSEIRKALRW